MDNKSRILIMIGAFLLGLALGSLIEDSRPIKVITVTETDTTLVNKIEDLEFELYVKRAERNQLSLEIFTM
jgi:hypothetical protein